MVFISPGESREGDIPSAKKESFFHLIGSADLIGHHERRANLVNAQGNRMSFPNKSKGYILSPFGVNGMIAVNLSFLQLHRAWRLEVFSFQWLVGP